MQKCAKRTPTIVSRLVLIGALFMQGCTGTGAEPEGSSTLSRWSSNVITYFSSFVARKNSYDLNTIFNKKNVVPIVIIGGGPAGLGAGLYAARENISTLIFEGPEQGGMLMKTTYVENWPGVPSILGPDIIKSLHQQVEEVGAQFLTDTVTSLDVSQWPFVIKTEDDRTIHALSVVIATGARSSKLGVPGEEEYWGLGGNGVSSCAICDARFTKGKDVVVVGGGDSAVEEALQLSNHAKSITILVRKDQMRAAASMQDRLQEHPNIKIIYNVEIKKIIGTKNSVKQPMQDAGGSWIADEGKITAIELYNNSTKESQEMPIDAVFLAVGHKPNSELFKGKVALDENGYIKTVGRTQHTSVPGIFAAGEVADNRYRQAGISCGEGNKAALDALSFLRSVGFNKTVAAKLEQAGNLWEDDTPYELPAISTLAELQEAFKRNKVVVLDFWEKNCPACLHMLPIVGFVAKKMRGNSKIMKAGDIAFFKVDTKGEINEVSELVPKFVVTKIPCILVFKDGQLVARTMKEMNKLELVHYINQFIR